MLTDAQKKASQRYNAKTYDQVKIVVPKGQREKIKEQAAFRKLSLNQYVVSLIERDAVRIEMEMQELLKKNSDK